MYVYSNLKRLRFQMYLILLNKKSKHSHIHPLFEYSPPPPLKSRWRLNDLSLQALSHGNRKRHINTSLIQEISGTFSKTKGNKSTYFECTNTSFYKIMIKLDWLSLTTVFLLWFGCTPKMVEISFHHCGICLTLTHRCICVQLYAQRLWKSRLLHVFRTVLLKRLKDENEGENMADVVVCRTISASTNMIIFRK